MTKIQRVMSAIALSAVLFIAGFGTAQWEGGASSHSNEQPPSGASRSGTDTSTPAPPDATQPNSPDSNSSDAKPPGTGDESSHIDKPGESK